MKRIVTAKELGEYLNLSKSRIEQLTSKGIIKKASRGRYELIPCLHGYIRYLRGQVAFYSACYKDYILNTTLTEEDIKKWGLPKL